MASRSTYSSSSSASPSATMISGAAATTLGPPTCGATARSTPRMSSGVDALVERVGDLPGVRRRRCVERDQARDLDQRERAAVEAAALVVELAQARSPARGCSRRPPRSPDSVWWVSAPTTAISLFLSRRYGCRPTESSRQQRFMDRRWSPTSQPARPSAAGGPPAASSSSSSDSEVLITVPPYCSSAATALSSVTCSMIMNSAEVPGLT